MVQEPGVYLAPVGGDVRIQAQDGGASAPGRLLTDRETLLIPRGENAGSVNITASADSPMQLLAVPENVIDQIAEHPILRTSFLSAVLPNKMDDPSSNVNRVMVSGEVFDEITHVTVGRLVSTALAATFPREPVFAVEFPDGAQGRMFRVHRDRVERIRTLSEGSENEILDTIREEAGGSELIHLVVSLREAKQPPMREFDRIVLALPGDMAAIDDEELRRQALALKSVLSPVFRPGSDGDEALYGAVIPLFVSCRQPRIKGDLHVVHPRPANRARREFDRLRISPEDVRALDDRFARLLDDDRRTQQTGHAPRIAFDTDRELGRVARAITNRRVGIALGGGGAYAYSFVPILRALGADDEHGAPVPIDVVSGISGGALVGAYYCSDPEHGLDQAIEDGPKIRENLARMLFDSRRIAEIVEGRLGNQRCSALPIGFLPVALAMQDTAPPQTHVLRHWRIGEAVRASGSLPIGFGPTRIGHTRYSDGAFASLIPVQVLSHEDSPADFVISANCVPAPSSSNPLGNGLFEAVLRHAPVVDRLLDFWVSLAYALGETSAQHAAHAQCGIRPTPKLSPLLRAVDFDRAEQIAEQSAQDSQIRGGITNAKDRWQLFVSASTAP